MANDDQGRLDIDLLAWLFREVVAGKQTARGDLAGALAEELLCAVSDAYPNWYAVQGELADRFNTAIYTAGACVALMVADALEWNANLDVDHRDQQSKEADATVLPFRRPDDDPVHPSPS